MVNMLNVYSLPLITFLDIEASGLEQPASYPIEFGWADTLGNSDGFLIRPANEWTHWDSAAESIHKICRLELFENGLTVIDAAEKLNDMLGSETVFCDGLGSDQFWLSKLFAAAAIEPSFELADVYQLRKLLSRQHMLSLQKVLQSQPVPHRAKADAERYAKAFVASYPKESSR